MDFRSMVRPVLAEDVDPVKTVVFGAGAFTAIAVVSYLSFVMGMPLMVASLGASAAILFGMPDSRPARPRNVIFGHLLSAVVAVVTVATLGCTFISAALAVTVSIVLMTVTDTFHPPGGATALFGVTSLASFEYVLVPVLAGALTLLIVAMATRRLYGYCLRRDERPETSA